MEFNTIVITEKNTGRTQVAIYTYPSYKRIPLLSEYEDEEKYGRRPYTDTPLFGNVVHGAKGKTPQVITFGQETPAHKRQKIFGITSPAREKRDTDV